jgi:hypothetical protein
LVGVYAYSAEKAGRAAGDLVGLGRKTGVLATQDINELLALKHPLTYRGFLYLGLGENLKRSADSLLTGV